MSDIERKIDDWADQVLSDLLNDDGWQDFVASTLRDELGINPEDLGPVQDGFPVGEESTEYRLWYETGVTLLSKVLATAITKSRYFIDPIK